MRNLLRYIVLTFTFLLFSLEVFSQISIAPTNIFVESDSRFASYMVINNSNQEQEIAIDFFFGYNRSDEQGNRKLITDDSTAADAHSVAGYINAFPQNFILAPNQRQVVRLRIAAPNSLEDGTYWARLRTSSTPLSTPVELTNDQSVAARVTVEIQQISSIYLKKGNVTTGIEVESIQGVNENDTFSTLINYNRLGNSPFLGTVTTQIINEAGEVVKSSSTSTTLHFSGVHKENFTLTDLEPGDYSVRVNFVSQRSDVSQSNIVQMEPVTATTTVTIP